MTRYKADIILSDNMLSYFFLKTSHTDKIYELRVPAPYSHAQFGPIKSSPNASCYDKASRPLYYSHMWVVSSHIWPACQCKVCPRAAHPVSNVFIVTMPTTLLKYIGIPVYYLTHRNLLSWKSLGKLFLVLACREHFACFLPM
jgi:hypothetical protein